MSEENKKDPLVEDEEVKEPSPKQEKKPEKPEKPTKAEVKPKAEKPAETKTDVESKSKDQSKGGAEAYMHGINITKEKLASSPHVDFIIPLTDGEKPGAYDTVQINGYRIEIKKGELVNVPIQVAKLLAEKYRINMTAGSDKLLNRANDVQNALS